MLLTGASVMSHGAAAGTSDPTIMPSNSGASPPGFLSTA